MTQLKHFFKSFYSLKSIFYMRNSKFFLTLLAILLVSLLFNIPLAISTQRDEELNYSLIGIKEETLQNPPAWFPEELPDCEITNNKLTCTEDVLFEKEIDDLTFIVDPNNQYTEYPADKTIIVLHKDNFDFVLNGVAETSEYTSLNGMDFKQYQSNDEFEDFFTKLYMPIKNTLMPKLFLVMFYSSLIMNLVFFLILSGLSVLFRLGQNKILNFKQMYSLVVYSAFPATLISVAIGLVFGPSAGTLVYNFAVPCMFFLVFWTQLKKEFNKG